MTLKKKVLIINYGSGNYNSIINTVKKFNCNVVVDNTKSSIDKADVVILPGVGTFYSAVNSLKKNNIFNYLKKNSDSGKFILGICLGLQVMSINSNEIKFTKGLKIMQGHVKKLDNVSHIGWNKVNFEKNSAFNFLDKKYFYFQHQYYVYGNNLKDKGYFFLKNKKILAYTRKLNTYGVQFHPEKSQESGLDFFKIFFDKVHA